MPSIHRIIWNKLGCHAGDIVPYSGHPWHAQDRRALVELFSELGYKIGAEIGVEKGLFSRCICDMVPGVKLYCVDPWAPYNKQSKEREDKLYKYAMDRLVGCNVEVMRMSSLEASQKIVDRSLDFVYIDALHDFDSVMMDIILWTPKVRSGGIVSGHDYVNSYGFGVIPAVNSYTQTHSINPWYITNEGFASWFWVNP
jgi:hypothetical protein